MKTVLVTGATGFLGRQLAIRLANMGYKVHAMYRSESKLRGMEHRNIIPFRGSLEDADSIERAMKGCKQVYHVAAFADVWHRDPGFFYEQNVGGTEHVLSAARQCGVEKLVFTSTAGVLGPSNGTTNTEKKQFKGPHLTHYDRSKSRAEDIVREFAAEGLPSVIVNPTRIFGPGFIGKSNAITMMIDRYLKGKWRLIPGNGKSIGNYVYVEDVVDCHILAMEKGRSGERYIAGGENLSYNEFFASLKKESGKNHKLIKLPAGMMIIAAGCMQMLALVLAMISREQWTPPIVPSFVKRYNHDWIVSSEKALNELGYKPVNFNTGLKRTIEWLKEAHMH